MRLQPQGLPAHLTRGLTRVYLVFGDEPLLVNEAVDAIRACARERGHNERVVFTAEPGFDWGTLQRVSQNLSLFSARQLIELRLPTGKPGDAGSQALQRYAAAPPEACLLLVSAPKLDGQAQKSAWFKAIEQAGAVIPVKHVEAPHLPAWIAGRMRSRGLQASSEAAALLAARVEGNLLAAAQEIEKLYLLHGNGKIGAEAVLDAVTDSARFTVYDLVESALLGDAPRVARILNGLRGEGVEPPLALWALTRELRGLATMAHALEGGDDIEPVLARHGIWQQRKASVKASLRRHPARQFQRMLQRAGACDQVIKGIQPGRPWDELLQLALTLAGDAATDRARDRQNESGMHSPRTH
jgi:DNA polymerase III subunit delta